MQYVLGIDVGTSGIRAGLLSEDGKLVVKAFVNGQLFHTPEGWIEQDMNDLYDGTCSAIRRCIAESGVIPRSIAAIAISGQMAGIGAVDRGWNPIGRYDSWLDARCLDTLKGMDADHRDAMFRLTGCPPTYHHGAKILWWRKHAPSAYTAVAKFVVPAVYVAGRLGGLSSDEAFIDDTYLHFSGFSDTAERCWSPQLVDIFEMDPTKLPRIVRPWQVVGEVTARGASDSGLARGTPIVAGAGDTAMSFLGAGLVEPGMAVDVAGTASVLGIMSDRFTVDERHRTLMCSRSVFPDLYTYYAFIAGGGMAVSWFRQQFAPERTLADLDYLAGKIPNGALGLQFVPHLSGRVSPANPYYRGAWVGLGWDHGIGSLFRAILESVAYEYQQYLSIVTEMVPTSIREVRTVGGGARSALWNQIKANVLGIPVQRMEEDQITVLGAAIVAGNAIGLFPDVQAATRAIVKTHGKAYEPEASAYQAYRIHSTRYRGLLAHLDQHFNEVNSSSEKTGSGVLQQ